MKAPIEPSEIQSRWEILHQDPRNARRVIARCSCGTEKSVDKYVMSRGLSRSCGCLQRELAALRATKHGMTGTPEFVSWRSMKSRCLNPRSDNYARYGGRGIVIAPEWLDDFECFLAHVGRKPSLQHTIDRIDNDGNYEPGNVRWATPAEQGRNRSIPPRASTCGKGHPFDEANTIVENSTGYRHCRQCRRDYDRSRSRAATS